MDVNTPAIPVTQNEQWPNLDDLSVIVQGGLTSKNCAEVAAHCQHWRELFAGAEIILSISSTDILRPDCLDNFVSGLFPIEAHAADSILRGALTILNEVCDRVVFARPVVPLPPIKSDSPKLNNANFQIAAAQAGLSVASRVYTLRIRNDLIFQDFGFIQRYVKARTVPRGSLAVFADRVLIGDLFTLNPYTIERLPFHFSDWFNFGLTESIRDLWDVPLITLRDAIYYRGTSHSHNSLLSERLFYTRLAVEQHVSFSCFRRHFPDLFLSYHNDVTCIDASMGILMDNFIICDVALSRGYMPKYAAEAVDHRQSLVCLKQDDWDRLAAAGSISPAIVLADKIAEAEGMAGFAARQPFPRFFAASRLSTRTGRLINGELVAYRADGVAVFGPHTTIPRGNYLLRLVTTTVIGPGLIDLRVTAQAGAIVLASTTVFIKSGHAQPIEIPFCIAEDCMHEVEGVCELSGIREFALAGMEFIDLDNNHVLIDTFDIDPRSLRLASCEMDGEDLCSTVSTGLIFYGPYRPIRAGYYNANLRLRSSLGRGIVSIRVSAEAGKRIFAQCTLTLRKGFDEVVTIPFQVEGAFVSDLEICCEVVDVGDLRISTLSITGRTQPAQSRHSQTPSGRAFRARPFLQKIMARIGGTS